MKSNIIKVNRLSQQTNRNTNTTVNQRIGSYSHTDHKIDAVNSVVRDQLAPRMAQLSANAILSDREAFFYYKRKKNGRRCSCFQDESNPDSDCRICYGTGFVGGYDKFGTHQEIVDFTLPYIVAVGCDLDYNNRAVAFEGQKGSYIEAEIDLPKNAKAIDTYYLGCDNSAFFRVEASNGSTTKVINSGADLEEFLGNKFKVKIHFLKPGYFKFLMIRARILDDLRVYADLANNSEAPSLDMFGEYESLSEIDVTFAGTFVSYVGNKDLMYRLSDGSRLKITSSQANIVSGTLVSLDVRARFLISMDKIEKILII